MIIGLYCIQQFVFIFDNSMYIDLFTMLEILYQKSKSKVHPFRNFNEILLSVIYSCPDQDKDVRKNLNLLVNERGNWSTKWNNRGDNLLNTLNKCKNCNTMHLGGSSWWHSCRSVVHFEPKKFDRVNSGGQGRSKYGPKLPLYCPLLLPILTFPDPPCRPGQFFWFKMVCTCVPHIVLHVSSSTSTSGGVF